MNEGARREDLRIGVLGGGQLGRMLSEAGRPLGVRFRFWDPGSAEPILGFGEHVRAAWDDSEALERFLSGLDLVTYEFENVPVELVEAIEERLPVRPGSAALRVAQDRLAEKTRFETLGIETNAFRSVDDLESLERAAAEIGLPAVLKTRRMGYDGKGQEVLRPGSDLAAAFGRLGGVPCILEAFVPFDREVSLVAVRDEAGELHPYPLVQNTHSAGILVRTEAPATDVSDALQHQAERAVAALAEDLGYVGTLAVEFFQVGDRLLANEMAPRVHNSGHWTQDGAITSQFENHIRAVCRMPVGSTAAQGAAVMLNLIGRRGDDALGGVAGATHHDYGKSERPGRKVGHVNVVGASQAEAAERAERAAEAYDGPELAPSA